MGWLFDSALSWLTAKILDTLNWLWNILLHLALTVPDVTTLPQVREITATSLMIVNSAFVLAIIAAAVVLTGRDTVQSRYGIAEFGPRLVLGWIGANVSTFLCANLIAGANALTQALAGDSISGTGAFGQLHDTIIAAVTNGSDAVLTVVIMTILAVLTGMLMVQWMVRLGLLVVVVGVAPIALACHATPWTEAAAKLWWRTLLGTLGTVVLQALALHVALSVFLDPAANVAALGIPNDPTRTFNLIIVVCLLWAVVRIPSLMRRYVTKGSPGSGAGIVRFALVQQLARVLTKTVTKGTVPTRGGGGAGGAAGGRAAGRVPRTGPGGGGGSVGGGVGGGRGPPPRPGGRGPGPSPVGRTGPTNPSGNARSGAGSQPSQNGHPGRAGRQGSSTPTAPPAGGGTPRGSAPRGRAGTASAGQSHRASTSPRTPQANRRTPPRRNP
jgi:hypothetical protein